MSHVYCPECGFQNPEAANYCARCGSLLTREGAADATQTFTPEELEGTELGIGAEEHGLEGPALVVRSGGGRTGETFRPAGERTVIGRSPDCDIFLDDVTVSRKHALLVQENGRFRIEDQSSLNGTFVNKKRIDSSPVENGDELQIGKYRLTFLNQ
jgi:pSer/pThr/pTyr-binding forkhead associated (FHA) protein